MDAKLEIILTQQLQEYNKLIFNNNCSDKGKIKIPD